MHHFLKVPLIFDRTAPHFRFILSSLFPFPFLFLSQRTDTPVNLKLPHWCDAALWFFGWSVKSFNSQLSHNAIGKRQANVVNLPNDTENGKMDGWNGWTELNAETGYPMGKCWGHCCHQKRRKTFAQWKWHTLANSINISAPNVITVTAIADQLEKVTFVGPTRYTYLYCADYLGDLGGECVLVCPLWSLWNSAHKLYYCIYAWFYFAAQLSTLLFFADCVWVSNWLSHYLFFSFFFEFRFGLKWIRLRLRLHCRLTELNVLLNRQESHVSAYISTVSFAISTHAPTQFELQLAAFGHG